MPYRVGVDMGGTFTEFRVFGEDTEKLHTPKFPSTPDRPDSEVITGIAEFESRHGVAPGSNHRFTCGITDGASTHVQHKGMNRCPFSIQNVVDTLAVAGSKMPGPCSLLSERAAPQ